MRGALRVRSSCRLQVPLAALALIALGACGSQPPLEPASPEPEVAAEAPADSPQTVENPDSAQAMKAAAVMLHAAQEAFDQGDYAVAMREWESVATGTASPRERAQALLGMALLRVLPASVFTDPQAAESLLGEFERHVREHALRDEFGVDVVILRALASSARELATLHRENRALRSDLAAREELIRKLRALSVGRD